MEFNKLIQRLSDAALAELAHGENSRNPCARWLAQVAEHEVARRAGLKPAAVPPLELGPDDLEPALAWLDLAAETCTAAAATTKEKDPLLLALMFDHLERTVQRLAAPAH